MTQAQVFGATLSLGIRVNPASASDYTQRLTTSGTAVGRE